MMPDRSLSPDGRFINDMRQANEAGCKEWHPPAKLPTHREVARQVLWWRCRCPKVRVVMAKRDFASAFKLLWVELGGLWIMAVSIVAEDLEESITVLYLI